VRLNWLLGLLNERVPTGTVFVFLDACRENAGERTWRTRAGAGAGPGSDSASGLTGSLYTGSAHRKL
jgi:hypothetical protein